MHTNMATVADAHRRRKACATSSSPDPSLSVFREVHSPIQRLRRLRPAPRKSEDTDCCNYFDAPSPSPPDISLVGPLPRIDFPARKGIPGSWEYARANGFISSAIRSKKESEPGSTPCHACRERVVRREGPSHSLHISCVRALFDSRCSLVGSGVTRKRSDENRTDSDFVLARDADCTAQGSDDYGFSGDDYACDYDYVDDDEDEYEEEEESFDHATDATTTEDRPPSASLRQLTLALKGRRRIKGSVYPTGSSSQADDQSASNGDITAEQAASGMDVQGIPWDNLPFSREDYRATRMRGTLRRDGTEFAKTPRELVKEPRRGARFYSFFQNTRRVKCSIVHFQLRNLAWATSKHDVLVMYDAGIVHWDAAARRKSHVLDLSGSNSSSGGGLPMVQISTMIAKRDLVIAGGFFGEMVAKNLTSGAIVHNKRITYDDNAITNAIDIFDHQVMTSNNDCYVRCFDMSTFQRHTQFSFPTPVNHATRQPDGKMVCVVGDDQLVQVIDGDSGDRIAQLHGHEDFSFATGWHPDSRLFATGSQDKTCRVWDVRNMTQSICVLAAYTGPVRSLRFSSCGRFLAMAEPKDFVHIYDVKGGAFDTCQEIDLFGEIAGIALSPCAETLYIAVSDRAYSSLMEYERNTGKFVTEAVP